MSLDYWIMFEEECYSLQVGLSPLRTIDIPSGDLT